MILLCGIPSEPPLAMVREALTELGAPTLVFNQRHSATTQFAFTIEQGRVAGTLFLDEQMYDLENIAGIYVRLMDEQSLPELDGLPTQAPERKRYRNLHEALLRWIEITPARVVNRYRPMGSNSSKPYQAQLIARHGFLVPETLITNDPGLAHEFYAEHKRVIYKSISGVRSIVQELTLADLARLGHIRWCPTQ
jgi:hypothetical protein